MKSVSVCGMACGGCSDRIYAQSVFRAADEMEGDQYVRRKEIIMKCSSFPECR